MGLERERRRGRDESGQGTLEVIGTIPIFLLVLGAVIQLFMIGYAAVAAESSARHAARSASAGASYQQAGSEAVSNSPDIFDATVDVSDGNISTSGPEPSVSASNPGDAVSAKAVFTVPFLGFGVKGLDLKVTRYAVVPRTD